MVLLPYSKDVEIEYVFSGVLIDPRFFQPEPRVFFVSRDQVEPPRIGPVRMSALLDVARQDEVEGLDFLGIRFTLIHRSEKPHHGGAADRNPSDGGSVSKAQSRPDDVVRPRNDVLPDLPYPRAILAVRIGWIEQMSQTMLLPAIPPIFLILPGRGSACSAIEAQEGSGAGIDCYCRDHRPAGSSFKFVITTATTLERHMKSAIRILASITAMSLVLATAPAQSTQPKSDANSSTVVFVCEHGAAKSVIAAAHFNRLATERGLPFRAVSRGIKPDDIVPDGVRAGLASDGFDVSNWRPTAVSDQDLRQAAQIVSLATDLPKTRPFVKTKLLEWNDVPPVSENYDVARTAIVAQVRKLLDTLSAPKKP